MPYSDQLQVRVVNVTRVSPPSTTHPRPNRNIGLSFFDTLWIAIPPVKRIFFYRPEEPSAPPFPSFLQELKSSLSHALFHFYPLAGQLTLSPESGELQIDCSGGIDGPGVAFVEAECDGDARRVMEDEVHDSEAFRLLVPDLEIRELPAPMLSVQVTGFGGGEVAIGFSFNHVVADGRAIWHFVKVWAELCRGGGTVMEPVVVSFDRSAIVHPDGDQISKRFQRLLAPTLPKMPLLPIYDEIKMIRRTFHLTLDNIRSLKERAISGNGDRSTTPISTFVAISAHVWINTMRAKSVKDDENTAFAFLVDCRSRLNPPVGDGYFGNCVKICAIEATGGELLGEDGFHFACTVIRRAVKEALEEPLRGCENMANVFSEVPMSRLANVAASPRFRVYDTDFGCGRPSRVELVSMNNDGAVVLVDAKEEGGVQVSVALPPLQMDAFASRFSDGGFGG